MKGDRFGQNRLQPEIEKVHLNSSNKNILWICTIRKMAQIEHILLTHKMSHLTDVKNITVNCQTLSFYREKYCFSQSPWESSKIMN